MPTHGSLSKAGKVRGQTPKIEKSVQHKTIPRKRNRKNFEKRFKLSIEKRKKKFEKNIPPRYILRHR